MIALVARAATVVDEDIDDLFDDDTNIKPASYVDPSETEQAKPIEKVTTGNRITDFIVELYDQLIISISIITYAINYVLGRRRNKALA